MRAITVFALLAAGVSMLAAQPQQPIRVGTNFVRVDAYPTRNGQIVDGLQAADFEVLEEGVEQKIETFEHVVALRGPQTARIEPNNQRDMMQALTNPRSRVFLVFLDGAFVDDQSARSINAPLVKFLTTQLGDDDLVGIMTPTMSAKEVTYGRKLDVLAGGLPTQWLTWGRKDRELDPVLDKKEIQYTLCYPGLTNDAPAKMIERSRERKTLESLQDAVRYLASVREERKAIVAVTEGWVLFREDPGLMEKRKDEAPLGVDKIRVGPTGKLTLEDTKTSVNALSPAACAGDRAYLAGIDNDKFLRDIIDDANRGNSTFYMIDPGGLKVKGADRNGAMRTLAENTDGIAVLNINDLDKGFDRISNDMSSYYLLGYYASNTTPDGRFRSITVRVKQPGIQVRARKGYRAPSENDIRPPAAITSGAAGGAKSGTGQRSSNSPGFVRPHGSALMPSPVRGLCARCGWLASFRRPRGLMSLRWARGPRFRRWPAARRRRAMSYSSPGNACSSAGSICRLAHPARSTCACGSHRRRAAARRCWTSFVSISTRPSRSPSCCAAVRRPGRSSFLRPIRRSAARNASGSSFRSVQGRAMARRGAVECSIAVAQRRRFPSPCPSALMPKPASDGSWPTSCWPR